MLSQWDRSRIWRYHHCPRSCRCCALWPQPWPVERWPRHAPPTRTAPSTGSATRRRPSVSATLGGAATAVHYSIVFPQGRARLLRLLGWTPMYVGPCPGVGTYCMSTRARSCHARAALHGQHKGGHTDCRADGRGLTTGGTQLLSHSWLHDRIVLCAQWPKGCSPLSCSAIASVSCSIRQPDSTWP